MIEDLSTLTDSLRQGVDHEDEEAVLQASRRIRETVDAGLEGRRLEAGADVLETKRQLHHRLEVVETKVRARRFDKAEEDLDEVAAIAERLAAGIDRLEPETAPSGGGREASSGLLAVAGRQVSQIAGSASGWLWAAGTLLGVMLAGTGAGALSGRSLDTVLLLAPLVGLHAGVSLVAEDREADRLHLLAARPISRAGVVAGKALGALGALGIVLALPTVVALLAAGTWTGQPTPLVASLTVGVGAWAVAASFLAIGVTLEDAVRDRALSWACGLLSYAFLGPLWVAAFESPTQGGAQGLADAVYVVSPLAATREALAGPGLAVASAGAGGLGILVPVAWLVAGLAWTAWRVQRDGFA